MVKKWQIGQSVRSHVDFPSLHVCAESLLVCVCVGMCVGMCVRTVYV